MSYDTGSLERSDEPAPSMRVDFPCTVRSVGDRDFWSRVTRLCRADHARAGEVYAVERHFHMSASGQLKSLDERMSFWRKGAVGSDDLPVDIFSLSPDTSDKVAPVVTFAQLDPQHGEMICMHLLAHHERRCVSERQARSRDYVCLLFWGGMLVLEESVFREHELDDSLLPEVMAGFGFGFIWREVPFARMQQAISDAEAMLGKYVAHRLYPGLKEPRPSCRSFGLEVAMNDSIPG